jgi:hypothetical protein
MADFYAFDHPDERRRRAIATDAEVGWPLSTSVTFAHTAARIGNALSYHRAN